MTFTPTPRKFSCTTSVVSIVTVAVSAALATEVDPATTAVARSAPMVVRLVHLRVRRQGLIGGSVFVEGQ